MYFFGGIALIAIFPHNEVLAAMVLLDIVEDTFIYLLVRTSVYLPIIIRLDLVPVHWQFVTLANNDYAVNNALLRRFFLLKDSTIA